MLAINGVTLVCSSCDIAVVGPSVENVLRRASQAGWALAIKGDPKEDFCPTCAKSITEQIGGGR